MLKHLTKLSKSNVYGRLLLILLFLNISVILSTESVFLTGNEIDGPRYGGMATAIFFFVLLVYFIFLLYLLEYPTWLLKVFSIAGILNLVGSLYLANPFVDVLDPAMKPAFFTFAHSMNMLFEGFMAYVILKDIFSSDETHTDHIWGAIVVYFFLVIIFAETYEIITLLNPGLLGAAYEPGWPNYTQCLMFSLNAISGMDSEFPEAHSILRKIGNLENIIGNLYLVVILGRLLSHPLKKNVSQ